MRHGIVLIVEQNTLIYFEKRQLMLYSDFVSKKQIHY